MKREEILEKLMEQELVDKHEYVILVDQLIRLDETVGHWRHLVPAAERSGADE